MSPFGWNHVTRWPSEQGLTFEHDLIRPLFHPWLPVGYISLPDSTKDGAVTSLNPRARHPLTGSFHWQRKTVCRGCPPRLTDLVPEFCDKHGPQEGWTSD